MSREKQIEEKSCKKCLHYEMCLDNFRRAKEEGLWELTDEEEYFAHADECDFCAIGYRKQSEWISVEERLPEETGKYLVATKNGVVYQTKYYSGGKWGQKDKGKNITYWMPLPEAPKMKGGAE